jgi:hypothetical protein
MPQRKIVLITMPYDQGDILPDFLEWHLHLGIDLIIAVDGGSTDGSRDVLEQYSKTHPVVWYPLPERDLTKYLPADDLTARARDQYAADWIIYADVDEFLCTRGAEPRTILADAERNDITMLTIRRHNVTGPPLLNGHRATETLTLRIDRTVEATPDQQLSWDFAVPFTFLDVGAHVATRASALAEYGAGMHSATTTWGRQQTSDGLYMLHYPIRGFDSLRKKVENTKAWLRDNPQWSPHLAWHWRRWISLAEQGRLREEYDDQFVSPERAQQLLHEGTCSVDTSVAKWIADRRHPSR